MKENNWTIGNNIRTVRKLKEISQELLSEQCEISVSMIQKVESGKTSLSMDKLIVILNVLGVSADTILSRERCSKSDADLFLIIIKNRSEKEVMFILDMAKKLLECKDLYLT